jgi:prophage regulatory protein
MAHSDPSNPPRLLRLRDVLHATGLSRSSLYELTKGDAFPRKVQLTARAVAWREDEVDQWIRDRISERDAEGSL